MTAFTYQLKKSNEEQECIVSVLITPEVKKQLYDNFESILRQKIGLLALFC